MTLEFAKIEAARRTTVLGTTHYVVRKALSIDPHGFMVLTSIPPKGYTAVALYLGKKKVCTDKNCPVYQETPNGVVIPHAHPED